MKCAIHYDRDAAGACVSCGRLVCVECKTAVGGQIYCNSCVEARLKSGSWPARPLVGADGASGMGSGSAVPLEVKGWNWGAFLLTWIWGIGNNVWISLLALLGILPYIGWIAQIAMAIILGLRGSEWAWQSKRWENLEHFRKTQRSWMWWGIGVLIFQVIAVTLLVTLVIVALIVVGALSYNDGFQWNYEPPDWW
jgi:hypothetical protein